MDLKNNISSLKKHVPDDFFIWLNYSFKLEGVMPPKDRIQKYIYLLFAVPHVFALTILALVLELINVYICSNDDIKMKMLFLTIALFDTIIVFRIFAYILTRSQLEKIQSIIRRESFNFDCFNIIAVDYEEAMKISRMQKISNGSVWRKMKPTFSKSSEIENYRIQKIFYTRLLCTAIYLILVGISFMTELMWEIKEAHAELYESFNPYLNKTSYYRKFQLTFYFPFDTSLDGHYWLGYFCQFYFRMGTLLSFLPVENVLTSSIIHLISQSIIIQEAFKYIDKNISQYQNARNVFLIKQIRLVKCINELQQIYRAIELLEEICSFQMMIQYGLASFLLCTLCYVFPMLSNLTEFCCCFVFLSACLGEIFIFSYVCQSLSLELQNAANSLYNIDWPFYPIKMKRMVVFTLSRLQKPANLTAGKFFIIDLVFFIQILQRAYSFYTLISNTRNAV